MGRFRFLWKLSTWKADCAAENCLTVSSRLCMRMLNNCHVLFMNSLHSLGKHWYWERGCTTPYFRFQFPFVRLPSWKPLNTSRLSMHFLVSFVFVNLFLPYRTKSQEIVRSTIVSDHSNHRPLNRVCTLIFTPFVIWCVHLVNVLIYWKDFHAIR